MYNTGCVNHETHSYSISLFIYRQRKGDQNEIDKTIKQLAMRPFLTGGGNRSNILRDIDELADGYIYFYWNRASFGLLKIGCTTRNVGLRLRQWEQKCKHFADKAYESPGRIKHVARVEKLVHAELENSRVIEPICRGCGGSHIEWFKDVDLKRIAQRVQIWTDWVMNEPYEPKDGVWSLKAGLENQLPTTSSGTTDSKPLETTKISPRKDVLTHRLRKCRTRQMRQVRNSD